MRACLSVAGRELGPGLPPYRIADAADHHEGDVQLGYKLIETAGAAGVDAIVFDAPGPGSTLSERDFKSLLGHAFYVGLTAFGTACDERQVAFLASLAVPAFVLAGPGPEALLRDAASRGKPVFIHVEAAAMAGDPLQRPGLDAGGPGVVALCRHDPSSLIEADGHVIMTRHTLERARPRAAAEAAGKGKQRA
jgi:sialic acid synthase SpsE